MPGVIHFEIPADDLPRAISFYSEVFGWQADKWSEGYRPVVTTGTADDPGINGALVQRSGKVGGVCNTIDVPSVDEFVARIEAAGGKCVVPKQEIPSVGLLAYCQDTEGNLFGIMQYVTESG